MSHETEIRADTYKGIHHPKMKALGEDYNLCKYTESSVIIFPIESNHASASYNSRESNIINKIIRLEPSVLQELKQENICEFYFMEQHKQSKVTVLVVNYFTLTIRFSFN